MATAIAPVAAAVALVATGCGEPTAQIVRPEDGPLTFEIPIEFTDLGAETDDGAGFAYGLPDTSLEEVGGDPVFLVGTLTNGDTASFASLRQLATFGEFDPRDPDLDPLPDDTELLGYLEITEPEVWGVRLRLAVGQSASDFQALVDRRTGQVTVSRVVCTQACFVDQIDLINEIQASWSLEPK